MSSISVVSIFISLDARPKVNVLTGRKGWHKRVNRSTQQVKRSAEFSDGVAIDNGAGLDKMESAVKKSVIKTIKTTKDAMPPISACFASSAVVA